ncbi:AbiTii domain-containing protein [Yoonia sp. GPGPB17]|uniref:AbiTii domain-containing protein n=1 Tax=Yoonia sp. GPGPB17 TaxID=3026147 RepID=UPI0030EE2301
MNNVTIPSHLVEQIAGKQWINYDLREGLAVIDQQLVNLGDNTHFSIDASNLKLLLQGKVYEGMAIVEINSRIDVGAFTRVQQTVRSKTLDFVLKLEKQIPSALEIAIGEANAGISPKEIEEVKQLTQQVFYGDVTNIHAGSDSVVNLSVTKGDTGALIEALTSKGIPEQEAAELAAIAKAEGPESEEAPLGGGAQEWVKAKLQDGASEVWGVGKAIAKEVIAEGLKQYYGLK